MTIFESEYDYTAYDWPCCKTCGQGLEWEDCGACEDGYSAHDCGDDTCCCLNPEPNIVCEQCGGNGGWWECLNCQGKARASSVRAP